MRIALIERLRLNTVEKLAISGLLAVVLDLIWVIRDALVHGVNIFYALLGLGFVYVIVVTIQVLIKYHNTVGREEV